VDGQRTWLTILLVSALLIAEREHSVVAGAADTDNYTHPGAEDTRCSS
jgi:hypothetical protein